MEDQIIKFNLRVYGIAFNAKSEVLLTDEFRFGRRMTKFPGGGLEFGEGTLDCLKREFREEMKQEIKIIRHFYTTDYFQPTKLLKVPQQLISIYYLIELTDPDCLKTTNKRFDFADVEGAQSFRWVKPEDIEEEEMTFPIDRKVMGMIKGMGG
jgi:ADP-ribose pyrophosphatase YjhB (NUDIX family)